MKEILALAKKYNKEKHINTLKCMNKDILSKLNIIFNEDWANDDTLVPYDVITYILDCYYILPERPDLASLFAWQAINNIYNYFLLKDTSKTRLVDTDGIELIVSILDNNSQYRSIIAKYDSLIPDKVFRFVASYLLKTNAIKNQDLARKFEFLGFDSLIKRIRIIANILNESYGAKYNSSNVVSINNAKTTFSIDASLSRKLTHSFSKKLKELYINGSTSITDTNGELKTYNINTREKMVFLIMGVLYASRCENFHGNVPSRMNSKNANNETYQMYFDLFLIEYTIIAICLHHDGRISTDNLNKVAENSSIML